MSGLIILRSVMPLIEMQEEEYAESDFTDHQLRFIQELFGPQVKDLLIHPPVPIQAVKHASTRDSRLGVGT